MARPPRVKYLSVDSAYAKLLDGCPSIDRTGSVTGMRNQFWGHDALIVRSGNYYYNVTSRPEVYERAI